MITKDLVWKALSAVTDPEMGYSIVELGLVYGIMIAEDEIRVEYTLTSPGCPAAEIIEEDMIMTLKNKFNIKVKPVLVWEPCWNPLMMSEELKIGLGYPV
ncbi:MAG: metal-sulfur cluster assembly factor [Spirochaetales bacterium]|nr:metal-sulfur cluster assembly factor [Spirochaetales bacterium]